MSMHRAVASVALKSPLALISVPTPSPQHSQVRVRVEWTASTPLDLHQNDGGLLVTHPQVLGDGTGGTVVEIGPNVTRLKVGDKVFGFTWRSQSEKAHQEYCVAEEWLFGKLPEGYTLQEAVTLPNNFVTVFHTLTTDCGIETPWPRPENYMPKDADMPILIWGGASSVGQFAIQILKYYGHEKIWATASLPNHEKLRSMGAERVFDYRNTEVVAALLEAGGAGGIPRVFDCIGSKFGSLAPISKIAKRGAKVAVLLPVIVRDSSEIEDPVYEMDVKSAAEWAEGVDARGVRTHFYLENDFFKYHLQPEIMPTMLAQGIVTAQAQKIVEGKTMLERAQKAMDMLRRKEVSMERLVWQVSDATEI
ncbi:chaperonin 10-like protein [Phaeosphaeriaceae sp. PMI808]|nr:chaperonin 10-like protein [Phaeosphaeriaceae sp. PMI808]